jgi:predicted SnoaL-like aldol condensation-catalyzing enzyme
MRGNVDGAHEYYADHYHDHTPLHPEQPGVHGLKEVMADVGQAAPDMRHEVLAIAGEDDLVFVHWQATGTHEGQYEVVKHARDVQPTGEEATVSGISLFRIEGASSSKAGIITASSSTRSSTAWPGYRAAALNLQGYYSILAF